MFDHGSLASIGIMLSSWVLSVVTRFVWVLILKIKTVTFLLVLICSHFLTVLDGDWVQRLVLGLEDKDVTVF